LYSRNFDSAPSTLMAETGLLDSSGWRCRVRFRQRPNTSLPDFSAAWTAVSMLISCPAMTYAGGRDGWLAGGTRCISHACPVLSTVVADGRGPRLPYFAIEGATWCHGGGAKGRT